MVDVSLKDIVNEMNIDKRRRILVFFKNYKEVDSLLDELISLESSDIKVRKSIRQIEAFSDIYICISIKSNAYDGLDVNKFILSSNLLRRGSDEEIKLAIEIGRNATMKSR